MTDTLTPHERITRVLIIARIEGFKEPWSDKVLRQWIGEGDRHDRAEERARAAEEWLGVRKRAKDFQNGRTTVSQG